MTYRTSNYSAFYVEEPFSETNLGANAMHDFVFYNQLRAWKAKDPSFPFVNAHEKTYNVRDDSSWGTLKKRLHERLDCSKNIMLFLSSITKESKALCEEIDYGINSKGLPVIVIYPDFEKITDIAGYDGIKQSVKKLWDKLPVFKNSMCNVATIHVPYKKEYISKALENPKFQVQTMKDKKQYYFSTSTK